MNQVKRLITGLLFCAMPLAAAAQSENPAWIETVISGITITAPEILGQGGRQAGSLRSAVLRSGRYPLACILLIAPHLA